MKAMSLFSALLGALTCACGAPVTNLEVADFEAKAADPAVFLVDVRTPEEYAEGHLRGAANIDWNAPDFLAQVQAACPKEAPAAVYCRTGRRSAEAAKALAKAGYAVCNLVGGIEGWQAAGKPVTKYAASPSRSTPSRPSSPTAAFPSASPSSSTAPWRSCTRACPSTSTR